MPTERRTDALSKERIVAAAIEILDADGEKALTFRALAARLSTGAGAIYWHVADKGALLDATTDHVVTRVVSDSVSTRTVSNRTVSHSDSRDAIRAVALGAFDAIDTHPWIGAHLSREPWQPGMLTLFEAIGGRLADLGAQDRTLFFSASALMNYILGVGGQNAANARLARAATDRAEFLHTVASRWESLDATRYPFLRTAAAQMRDHDDREQFLAGVDLILAGITSTGVDSES